MAERIYDEVEEKVVKISIEEATIEGNLAIPEDAVGVILFAHGSGSSRFSPRNQFVADYLRHQSLGTLLIDLLTPQEETLDNRTGEFRFNIPLLSERLVGAVDWLASNPETRKQKIGCFGASTGAAAALMAGVERPDHVKAIVSRGGRPDLAEPALALVTAPTLLVVGGLDLIVIDLNRKALKQLPCEKHLAIVPGATHLFEEPGALEEVAKLATDWFLRHFE